MLQVVCIDAKNSGVLVEGRTYYAFPTRDGTSAYISNFARQGANFGGFQMSRFKEVSNADDTPTIIPTKEIEGKSETFVCKYNYHPKAPNETFQFFGFQCNSSKVALFHDAELTQYLGATSIELCEEVEKLHPLTKKFKGYIFTQAIRMVDLLQAMPLGEKTADTAINEVIEPIRSENESEQLSLF